MNHKNILSKHSKEIALIGFIFVGFLLCLLIPSNPYRVLVSRKGFSASSLFHYASTDSKTHLSLASIKGNAIQKNSAGQLFLASKDKAWMAIPFHVDNKAVVNLYVNAWSVEDAKVQISLMDATNKVETVLLQEESVRNKYLDLSHRLKKDHTYWVYLSAYSQSESGRILIESINISSVPGLGSFPRFDLILLLAVFLLFIIKRDNLPHHVFSAGFLLFLLSFSLRWSELGKSVAFSLNGDALGYFQLVKEFSPLKMFHTGVREPLFIWLQYFSGLMFGLTEFHFRVLTLALSVSVVIAVYFWIYKLTNDLWAAFGGGFLISIGDFFVFNAVRGERVELFILLGLIFLILSAKKLKSKFAFVTAGLVAALMSLTWLIGLFISLAVFAIQAIKNRYAYKNVAYFLIPIVLLIGPYLLVQKSVHQDALIALNAHTNFYKNAKDSGQPSYEGEKVSLITYIFKDYGVLSLVGDTVKGFGNLFFNPNYPLNRVLLGFHYSNALSWMFYPFLIFGIGFSLWKKNFDVFLFLFCFLNISVAFLDQIRDPRLFYHVAPFFGFFFGVGLSQVRTRIWSIYSLISPYRF